MANWCYNKVNFEGGITIIKELQNLFEALTRKEEKEKCGQLPEFIKSKDGYLFSIRWEDDALYYETRWSPNTEIIQRVADKFGVGFTHFYEELGCLIYGEAIYQNKMLTDIFLDVEDFDKYEELEEDGTWLFEGESFESDCEILEILLERKKEQFKNEKK
jgi:hypothetical protein